VVSGDGALDGGEVLPGLKLPLATVFKPRNGNISY
jgi:hypothetical protein